VPTAEREGVVTHQLEPEAASVPEARRIATDFARSVMSDRQMARLEVAISEVVGNAVRHSGSSDEIRLMLTRKDGYLCVRVTDGGNGLVPKPGAMSSEPGAGYGLFLVEQMTRRWGVTREDGRTRVWFEIDYAAGGSNGAIAPDAPCDPV
jgi:anti-sigma regulatory factor (Ser/Thr protein kinase)